MKFKILFISFSIVIFFLFLYSYTQTDLSLTLSRVSVFQIIEKFFQHIGYFNRPLSTAIYLIILFLLFINYFFFLKFSKEKKISLRNVWVSILFVTFILTFAYNAFSYDLFNYIFDAKIITHYNLNPYFYKALDFPHDPMLSFMHWTQRTYPYGPFWLVLTVPLSFLGFNFFLPTFFLFKILASISFLGTCFFIVKIAKKLNKNESFILTSFALNPLVIIETLVSGHNDIEMVFFAILAIYLFIYKRYFTFLLSLFFSIGIKFATIFILPIILIYFFLRKKIDDNFFIYLSILMFLAIIIATLRSTFQPWYLLFVLPFVIFLSNEDCIIFPIFILSITSLLNYTPFLFIGNWNAPIPQILLILNLTGIILSLIIIFLKRGLFLKNNL